MSKDCKSPEPAPPEWDLILSAAQKNNSDDITRLVQEENVSPSHANAVGQSALHIAALWGNVEAVETLLALGAMPNSTNRITGATPLHCTVQSSKQPTSNRVACADRLLEHGANPNLGDVYGSTPLDYASEDDIANDMDEMRDILLKHSGPGLLLFEMIDNLDAKGVTCCLGGEEKVDLEGRDDRTGQTAFLHCVDKIFELCSGNGNKLSEFEGVEELIEILEMLLATGANPNALTRKKQIRQREVGHLPPVMSGYGNNQNESSQVVEDSTTAALHVVCTALAPSLAASADADSSLCVRALLRAAALLHKYHATVPQPTVLLLHDAARRDNIGMVKFMIETLDVCPNVRGRQGLTPLHFAARSGKVRVVQYLLSLGDQSDSTSAMSNKVVDVTLEDDGGRTALDAAVVNNKTEVANLLRERMEGLRG